MDIKIAYLNADIEEEIFMQKPEGFEKFDKPGNPWICKLRKNLYGLKQRGRNWYLTIKNFLSQLGFTAAFQDFLSSSVENPGRRRLNAAKGSLHYLKGTESEKMILRKSEKLELKGFSDQDWAGNLDHRRSICGYCFKTIKNSGAINWVIKLQKCVSTSTAEAELRSKEAVHLVNLLKELDLEIQQPVNFFVDNQVCIALSKNSMNHGKTNHFALKVHFVRNLVESRLLELNYLSTDGMPADTFIKALGRTKVSLFLKYFSEQTLKMIGGVLKV